MGIDVNTYMQKAKYFRNEGKLFDAIESIAANLSITTELEKVDREQIEKLSLRVENIEQQLQQFIETPLWKLAVRRVFKKEE